MNTKITIAACTILMASLLCGCQNMGSTALDTNWGQSYESAKYLQVLHPEAGGPQVVENIDGQAADTINKQYQKSFTQKQKMTTSESILKSIVK